MIIILFYCVDAFRPGQHILVFMGRLLGWEDK